MAGDILRTTRDDDAFIREVLRRCWSREPEPELLETARNFFTESRDRAGKVSADQLNQVTPTPMPAEMGIRDSAVYVEFCLVAFNTLEFIVIQ